MEAALTFPHLIMHIFFVVVFQIECFCGAFVLDLTTGFVS